MLTPEPTTTQATRSRAPGALSSSRPATLAPRISTSFGHLTRTSASAGASATSASASARLATSDSCADTAMVQSGRNSSEAYRLPRGEFPSAAMATASLDLLGRDHHGAGSSALLGQPARLVVGALDPIESMQHVAGGQLWPGRHDNSAAAAIAAWLRRGPGRRQNSRLNRAAAPTITVNSRPTARSSGSAASSKYITLTMRM